MLDKASPDDWSDVREQVLSLHWSSHTSIRSWLLGKEKKLCDGLMAIHAIYTINSRTAKLFSSWHTVIALLSNFTNAKCSFVLKLETTSIIQNTEF